LHNFGELALARIFPPHHRLVSRAREVNPHFDPSVIESYLPGISRNDVYTAAGPLTTKKAGPMAGKLTRFAWSRPDLPGENKEGCYII